MLLSIELSGPALLTETSSSLLTTIIRERVHENPTHFTMTSERILSWLFSKWTPSKFDHRPLCTCFSPIQVFGLSGLIRL
jgi:ataxia telangiectasia mutated family protein